MKQFLFSALAVLFLTVNLFGQNKEVTFKGANGIVVDTVSNTNTKSITARVSGYQDVIAIQPVLTKISGTTAGTVRLFGSVDGANYVRINTTDSLVASNVASQSKIFLVTNHAYEFYRITYVGSGTHVTTLKALLIARKR